LSVVELSPERITVEGYQGVDINVWDYGGDGTPLILCHCTGTHARIWDPIAALLKDQFRIIAADTRGHGDSGKPDDLDAYTWKNSGFDLYNVIQHFRLTDVRAVGHSAGASQICYGELAHPGTFHSTVLMDPIIGPPNSPDGGASPMGDAARRRREVFSSFQEAIERFGSKPPLNSWTKETLEAYVQFGFDTQDDETVKIKCPGRIEGTIYDRGGAYDVFQRLEELTFPATLVTGEHSNVKHMIDIQRDRMPNNDFQEIPQASHFIPQEYPQEIADIISNRLSVS